MRLAADGRLDPTAFATHRFALGDTMAAHDTFADAATTNALKIVLQLQARSSRTIAASPPE
jgi:alcohol dehydrogenase